MGRSNKCPRILTKLGIDGFRCDVAPIVPMPFWIEARKRIKQINPESILLAETVHPTS